MRTAGETARGLRDRPLGKALLVAVVLVLALVASKSCARTETKVSQSQAIAIAERQVTFEPNNVMVRLLKRGFKSRPFWAVSLSTKQADGTLANVTVVLVNGITGEVDEIRRSGR